MTVPTSMRRPQLKAPSFPREGDQFVFADREQLVENLYSEIVSAGNMARETGKKGTRRLLVYGYMGVGKSALIFEVLRSIREDGRVPSAVEIARPIDPERWFMLRISGRSVVSLDGLQGAVHEAVVRALSEFVDEAVEKTEDVLRLGLFARRPFSKDAILFSEIRNALDVLKLTIEYVRDWLGGKISRKTSVASVSERSEQIGMDLTASLEARAGKQLNGSSKIAAQRATKLIERFSSSTELTIEHITTVGPAWVIAALNDFFAATRAAKIPTIVVVDDLDEFAMVAGTDYALRMKQVSEALAVFTQLEPTFLIVAARTEYTHGDVFRQFGSHLYIPPMTRSVARRLLSAWAGSYWATVDKNQLEELCVLGEALVKGKDPEDQVVVPLMFLKTVCNLWNKFGATPPTAANFLRTLYDENPRYVSKIIEEISNALSHEDTLTCLRNEPLNSSRLNLSDDVRQKLMHPGLLRPANAQKPDDLEIFLDPSFGYFSVLLHPEWER